MCKTNGFSGLGSNKKAPNCRDNIWNCCGRLVVNKYSCMFIIRALARACGSVAQRVRRQRRQPLEGPKGPRVAKTCESEGPKGPRTSKARFSLRRLPVLLPLAPPFINKFNLNRGGDSQGRLPRFCHISSLYDKTSNTAAPKQPN